MAVPVVGGSIVTDTVNSESSVPQRVLQIFHDEKARPKVIRTYDVNVGWAADSKSSVLTWQTVDDLIERGKTSVELKWRFKKHHVSLLELRPQRAPVGRIRRRDSRGGPRPI
jgi:hypothetical protein